MLDVMIDVETMSVRHDAAIVAIGAVKFDRRAHIGVLTDPDNPEYKHFYCTIELESCMEAGLRVDGPTINWWLLQSDEARATLREEPHFDLQQALGEFWNWYGPNSLMTWGNGMLDCATIRNAYLAFHGVTPFNFRHERCYRTMREEYPDVPFVEPKLKHHALQDAIAQAVHIQKLSQR